MRVALDDQIFTLMGHGGIPRYFAELVRATRARPDLDVTFATPFTQVVGGHLTDAVDELAPTRLPGRLAHPRVLRALNRGRLRRGARAADLLHHTYFLPEALDLPARRRVCTVYDMIPERGANEGWIANAASHRAKEDFVRRADAALCISETTKADVLDIYGPLDKPVVVTPLAAPHGFAAAADRARGATPRARPYVLHLGKRHGYKNFDLTARALGHLASTFPDLEAVLVGGEPVSEADLARWEELGLAGRVHRIGATDDEVPGLYADAAAFVFPSRYEGFGIPIVEAFAAGCPVVVTTMACSLEVAAGAAPAVGTDDDEALAAALEPLIGDPGARQRAVEAGRRRGADYTWDRTAELTAGVYRGVAG